MEKRDWSMRFMWMRCDWSMRRNLNTLYESGADDAKSQEGVECLYC